MQRALLMRIVNGQSDGLEPARNAPEPALTLDPSPIRWERVACKQLGKALAFNVIHRKVMLAVLLPDLMNSDNVGMAQIGRDFGFRAKPCHIRVAGELARENHLHRH